MQPKSSFLAAAIGFCLENKIVVALGLMFAITAGVIRIGGLGSS